MSYFSFVNKNNVNLVSLRAYQGDALTFLAFDLDASLLDGFSGFSIKVKPENKAAYFLINRLTFAQQFLDNNAIDEKEKLSSEFSPFQKFSWIHVPATDHNIGKPVFGKYTYSVTPRYIQKGKLQPLDETITVSITIVVQPFEQNKVKAGFTRAFISSQAYVRQFGMNNQVRPNDGKLLFDITTQSGTVRRWNKGLQVNETVPYTFEEQHKYLGWQARERVMELLEETLENPNLSLDVFAYDLNEPIICEKLLSLASQGRLRIILDNAGEHNNDLKFENQFEQLFHQKAVLPSEIFRGHFGALSHSKIFIQKKDGKALKVLTGSTNFSTNGLYVNANHVLVFEIPSIADLYEEIFEASWGKEKMDSFKESEWAAKDFNFQNPDMTIRFSPHPKQVASTFFDTISTRINNATSDVLFAIMKDNSASSILDAVRNQVKSDKVYTYGITDSVSSQSEYTVFLYKPNSKRGVRVAAKGNVLTKLPPPFENVPKIDGYAIHHKFVVVDFKGENPVVYCGSSNLAFGPEQQNGDNLLEIRDPDIVTVFALEAIRLVDMFQWRNKELTEEDLLLNDLSNPDKLWYQKYYNPDDLRCMERQKFIS
jgi:phosphatidylserine/phosphatidylglycerophosphate/cardiolipin synthase-like enzyme